MAPSIGRSSKYYREGVWTGYPKHGIDAADPTLAAYAGEEDEAPLAPNDKGTKLVTKSKKPPLKKPSR
jgi:hypothetical protein